MTNDIEAQIICGHMANDFNDLLIEFEDETLLTEFVKTYVYEFDPKYADY
jgi:hypothetical protein